MIVVRYTYNICLRNGLDKDTYDMAKRVEEHIMKCDGVCGCEIAHEKDNRGYNSFNVDDAIEWQRSNRRWLGERGASDGR